MTSRFVFLALLATFRGLTLSPSSKVPMRLVHAQFDAGRLLIRKLIADKLKIPWNEILLQRSPKGKPFLVNDISKTFPNFSFNVSHQGEYAVLAAEVEFQVGVDVMKTELPGSGSIREFFRIMKRQFTEKEWKAIKCAGSEWSQLDMFYRHWALKESFIKAIGVGVGFNLQRIEFNASPVQLEVGKVYKETSMLLDGDEEEGWSFEEIMLDNCHHVAVALGKPDGFVQQHSDVFAVERTSRIPMQFTVLTFEDLVVSAVPLAPEDPTYWDNFHSKQEAPLRQRTNST
ncbi:L-aminoadipate-semialdehyde dehydrogenase-phosphopantetheinyl transferase isoform X2 [Rhinatrema bivittatum]|uniref:L-aminoadipate-semialdehyde dehydrogenase-phosphopantetheinyl transferase isoform X2 n=1 Tax=Rhinatrema bivittatum TaxID=194408 RepID=UPI00112C7F31|nr:L-aminoadipate-semialdehyde dehydrogenase-phosphopantetheinyl transferase isoform X2 [Rhinatrema bivittatum]